MFTKTTAAVKNSSLIMKLNNIKMTGFNEVNPKVQTKLNIKLLANEFGIAPDSFLLV